MCQNFVYKTVSPTYICGSFSHELTVPPDMWNTFAPSKRETNTYNSFNFMLDQQSRFDPIPVHSITRKENIQYYLHEFVLIV